MPYFVFNMELDNELKNKYLNIFERINEFGEYKDKSIISGTDGITIYFTHNEKGIVKEYLFWTPSSETDLSKSIIGLLAMPESVPFGVVHKTVRDITNFFGHKEWYIKSLKDDTVYIKILKQPYPCSESVRNLVKSLPYSEILYVDMVSYQGKDTPCFANELSKKFKEINWILEPNRWELTEFFGIKK